MLHVIAPPGTPLHKRVGVIPRISKTTTTNYKRYSSLIHVGVATIDVYPKKYQFKNKKLKNPKDKSSLLMCLSQIIKIVLVMLISGVLLSENTLKHTS